MKKIEKIFIFYILISFLYSCSGASDVGKVLRNEKTKSTDEFLVKKRDPLNLPPDYKSLPAPDTLKKSSNDNNINKILKIPKEKKPSVKGSSSVEQSIINEIRK